LEKFVAPLRRHFGRALKFSVQTNGVLVDESWIQFFAQYEMSASVSLDGPREIHDANRPKANGSGSYDAAVAAIHKLLGAALKGQLVSPGVLAVFSPEITGEVYFDSIVRDLGVKSFDLLFPDHAYADPSTLAEVIARYSAAVDAIWRRWLAEDDPSIDIRFITQSLHAVARGAPLFNPDVQRPIVIDLNGDIFIEDGLRASVDYHDLKLGNWRDEVFDDLMKVVEAAGRRSASTPDGCENCANLARCRGGDITTRLQLEGGRYGRPPLCDVFQGGFTHAENVLKTVGARRAQSA
jgi:uncharacterized protein